MKTPTICLPQKVTLPINDILYLQSESNYTSVVTNRNHPNHFVALCLYQVQSLVESDSFVRVNRSVVVNMLYVRKIDHEKDTLCLTLKNNKKLRTSRRRTRFVLESLGG